MLNSKSVYPFVVAMAFVVVLSNILVQFPVGYSLAGVNLGDVLTWGAFTYPIAFLVTDLTNRLFGAERARRVVMVGFVIAVICSILVPKILFSYGSFPFELSPSRIARVAMASGTAFLVAQLLDISIFSKLRQGVWWRAPLVSSFMGSLVDTCLFFGLAFAASFAFLGENDGFALENAPMLAVFATEIPRWISWAAGDFMVKILAGLLMLAPYSLLVRFLAPAKKTNLVSD